MHEIIFVVQDSNEGGFTARAVEEDIFTEADTMDELREAVRDAVRAHLDAPPALIRLHYVRDEVIAA